jgi:hypothetical protein
MTVTRAVRNFIASHPNLRRQVPAAPQAMAHSPAHAIPHGSIFDDDVDDKAMAHWRQLGDAAKQRMDADISMGMRHPGEGEPPPRHGHWLTLLQPGLPKVWIDEDLLLSISRRPVNGPGD